MGDVERSLERQQDGLPAIPRRIGALRSRIIPASGWKRAGIAFLSGLASVLALAPFFLWPILFLTMPVLVWLIDAAVQSPGQRASSTIGAAAAGWWFGFGYFIAGLFWIGEAFLVEAEKYAVLLPFAVTLLPAGLAFFFAAAAAAASLMWRQGLSRVIVLAVALGLTEWLRGHILTGFPWNLLGYALTSPLALMQSVSLFGVYSLTAWAVLIFAAPLVAFAGGAAGLAAKRERMLGLALAGVPLLAFAIFGALKLASVPPPPVAGVKLRIVQPSVSQAEKWRPENQGRIFRDHLDLSQKDGAGAKAGLSPGTVVIWPEAAMPFLPLEHPEAMAAIADVLPSGTLLLSGALRRAGVSIDGERHVFNSLIAFHEDASTAAIYDKNHLVPFGEYLPFAPLFRAIGLRGLVEMRGAFESGTVPRPLLQVPGLPAIGALICYEAIFPGDVVQGVSRPGFLLSVTNDGWFGDTTGPRQHFHQARVRAAEEGLPIVRAANNGISAVIDADGRVLKLLPMNVRGVIDAAVPSPHPPTMYAVWGDWMFALNILAIAALVPLLTRFRAS